MGRLTRVLWAWVSMLTLLVLAGCSTTLPTDTTPQPGLPVDVQPRRDLQRFLTSPQQGAPPAEIVQGFLRANVGFADDEDVARRYLTGELARAWVPTSQVLVLDTSPVVSATSATTVSVTIEVAARIDAEGRLVEQPPDVAPTQDFELTQVEGEWRISEFPSGFGLWLSAADLERAFRASTVYYLNPHEGVFVPDVRWLAMGEGLTTSLTRAQLSAVPPHLEGAVRTAAGEDLRLVVGAVPVDAMTQVATVNLQGSGIGEGRARDLRAQLGHSLLALSGVNGVDVQIGGRSLEVDGDSAPVTGQSTLHYRDATSRVRLGLLRLGESLTPVDPARYDMRTTPAPEDIDLPSIGLSWTGVAASADVADLAAVSTDRTRLRRWRDGEVHTNSGIGDQLTDPSFDRSGSLWLAGVARSDDTPRVWVIDQRDLSATARPLDTSVLRSDDRILQLRTSPDGARVLMVLGRDNSTTQRLVVAGIVRDSEGRAFGIAEPLNVAPTLRSVVTARWASVDELFAVGGSTSEARPGAFRVPLGEWIRPFGDQVGLVDIYAVPTGAESYVVIRTEDGRFHTPEGSGWYGARNGDDLIIPGT